MFRHCDVDNRLYSTLHIVPPHQVDYVSFCLSKVALYNWVILLPPGIDMYMYSKRVLCGIQRCQDSSHESSTAGGVNVATLPRLPAVHLLTS